MMTNDHASYHLLHSFKKEINLPLIFIPSFVLVTSTESGGAVSGVGAQFPFTSILDFSDHACLFTIGGLLLECGVITKDG